MSATLTSSAASFGAMPLSFSLDTVGPLTRTVADNALMLRVLAGFDARDPATSRLPVPDYLATVEDGAKGLRLGVPENHFFAPAADEVRHILLDRAKLQIRLKRGDERLRVPLTNPDVEAIAVDPAQALELDAALDQLSLQDERAAEVVNLHYFAGLGVDQVAEILGVAPRTVARDWRFAAAFLKARLR